MIRFPLSPLSLSMLINIKTQTYIHTLIAIGLYYNVIAIKTIIRIWIITPERRHKSFLLYLYL